MRIDRSGRVNPGLRKERIHIRQKMEGAQDSYGQPAVSYSIFATCYARIKPMQGQELALVGQTWAKVRWRIEPPYIPGVTTEMDIIWGDLDGANNPLPSARVFHIVGVSDPDDNQLGLRIYCYEWRGEQ